ncbi:Zn-dependent hydrolase [Oceanobacillus sp. E9]|uniref:M20 family metallo-hydrolase n=1 Tax=Oceanobacillus sp. E9 TaxID=1742575 RepID=UPI00084EA132|nr:M20 family metallo-hydrolase [Oceanobacillus sp. E9]OEH56309.1 Zn-dependent hydrolase [Oceanobacillus sp. E9]
MINWLEEKLCALNVTSSMNQSEGFTRLGYSDEEKQAHTQFINIANELGLHTFEDEAGNQWAVWKVEENAPTIGLGSHLDTVYSGGGYDGVAGVLCALAAVKTLKDKQITPKKNIAVICFASEESARFSVSTLGSKAVSGELNKEAIKTISDQDGTTIKQAMEQVGLNWEKVQQAERAESDLEQFLELHIEQGKILEEQGFDIGIVHGIARPIRLSVRCEGMANHTGTTPMNNRQDALVAIAPLINFVEQEALKMNERVGASIVATASVATVKPNAMNMIPGEVELGIDIRSTDNNLKQELYASIYTFCESVEKDRNVKVMITMLVNDASVELDKEMQGKLFAVSKSLGYKTISMDSGAGHDVMNMAMKWPSGLIFIPSHKGISHHPDEFTEIKDLANGTKVIAAYLESEVVG